jgi:YVTN family beta-propeller protein
MFTNNSLSGLCKFSFAALLSFLVACEGSKENTTPKGAFEKGVLIINEGGFQASNSSLSFYDRSTKTIENDIFRTVNSRTLGDILQSVTVVGSKAFIIVNNSNKIEIADANTMKSLAPQIDLKQPRYAAFANGKLYVTEWINFSVQQGQVSVIDVNTYKVLKTIAVGKLPEQIFVANNGKLYITNSGGNTISVINTAIDAVETSINVLNNPTNILQDANNNIWVLCAGTSWSAPPLSGGLVRFNPNTPTNQVQIPFAGTYGGKLVVNGNKNKLYLSHNGAVWQMDILATTLPTSRFIPRDFYGLGIDNDGTIYGSIANFSGSSRVIRYSSQGVALDSVNSGVGTNGFLFR